MKHVAAAAGAFALSSLLSSHVAAAQRPASCTLVVKGKSYIEGECLFEADPDGSFRIFGADYFAYVNVDAGGKTAEASWNGTSKASHAHEALGNLTRKGACWENAGAKVCARALTGAKAAAAMAAQPKGEMIYPAFPGASQSCVIARGGKWVEGAQLVLDNCPADNSSNRFLRTADMMKIDKADGLCAGVARGGPKPLAAIQKCGDAGAKWSSSYKPVDAATVRSADNECWTIPKLADDKAKFPFDIVVAPCDPKADRQLKFFFEKS